MLSGAMRRCVLLSILAVVHCSASCEDHDSCSSGLDASDELELMQTKALQRAASAEGSGWDKWKDYKNGYQNSYKNDYYKGYKNGYQNSYKNDYYKGYKNGYSYGHSGGSNAGHTGGSNAGNTGGSNLGNSGGSNAGNSGRNKHKQGSNGKKHPSSKAPTPSSHVPAPATTTLQPASATGTTSLPPASATTSTATTTIAVAVDPCAEPAGCQSLAARFGQHVEDHWCEEPSRANVCPTFCKVGTCSTPATTTNTAGASASTTATNAATTSTTTFMPTDPCQEPDGCSHLAATFGASVEAQWCDDDARVAVCSKFCGKCSPKTTTTTSPDPCQEPDGCNHLAARFGATVEAQWCDSVSRAKVCPKRCGMCSSSATGGVTSTTVTAASASTTSTTTVDPNQCRKAQASQCFTAGVQWAPHLNGTSWTNEADRDACQKRCQSVQGCAHFLYLPHTALVGDGACSLQGSGANQVLMPNTPGLVSGPPSCASDLRPVDQDPAASVCFSLGTPMMAPGMGGPWHEATPVDCQSRCRCTPGCATFYWVPTMEGVTANWCFLQDDKAYQSNVARHNAIGGPRDCRSWVTTTTTTTLPSCVQDKSSGAYEPDMSTVPSTIGVGSAEACMQRCSQVAGCAHFLYNKKGQSCSLQDCKAKVGNRGGAIGPPSCASSGSCADSCHRSSTMWAPGFDKGPLMVASASECQKRCASVQQCAHFTYAPAASALSNRNCFLSNSSATENHIDGATAGPPHC